MSGAVKFVLVVCALHRRILCSFFSTNWLLLCSSGVLALFAFSSGFMHSSSYYVHVGIFVLKGTSNESTILVPRAETRSPRQIFSKVRLFQSRWTTAAKIECIPIFWNASLNRCGLLDYSHRYDIVYFER